MRPGTASSSLPNCDAVRYDSRLALQPIGRGLHHPPPRGRIRAVHWALVRVEARDRHRAHRGAVRGPRQQPLPGRPGDAEALLRGPTEPDARSPGREPPPEARPRRGRLAATDEPLLIRGAHRRRETVLRPDRRPPRPRRPCPQPRGMRRHRHRHNAARNQRGHRSTAGARDDERRRDGGTRAVRR